MVVFSIICCRCFIVVDYFRLDDNQMYEQDAALANWAKLMRRNYILFIE